MAFRVDVGGGRDADGAGGGRTEIGQDVAEQVGADHHVEPVRMLDEVRGQDVDVVLVRAHLRIARLHGVEALVPVRHGDGNAVRLGGRGDVLFWPAHGQLERVLQDAIHALAGERGLLDDGFAIGAFEHAPANRGILSLGVLAHHPVVDVADVAVTQRRHDAGHEAHRAQIDVQIEPTAHGDEHLPQRNVVRHAGKPARAEEDGVVPADGVQRVGRHHAAVAGAVFAAPGIFVPLEFDAEPASRRFDGTDTLGADFAADAIPGNECDTVFLHVRIPMSPVLRLLHCFRRAAMRRAGRPVRQSGRVLGLESGDVRRTLCAVRRSCRFAP